MDPTTLLKEYGKSAGVPSLAFDAHGCARLRFASSAEVNLEVDPSGEWIHFYAVLGPVPPGSNEGLYQRLLNANSFGTDTRGATLSIDAARNEILLCQRIAANVAEPQAFGAAVENFAAAAQEWHSSLVDSAGGQSTAHSAHDDSLALMTHLRA
jgi:hypothetical protein